MKSSLIIVCMFLAGCAPAEPLTDAQVKAVAELCDKRGMVLLVYNTGTTNYAECR